MSRRSRELEERVCKLVASAQSRVVAVDRTALIGLFGQDKPNKDDAFAEVRRVVASSAVANIPHGHLAFCGELLQSCLPPDNSADMALIRQAADLIGAVLAARKTERGYSSAVKVEAERAIKWLQVEDRFDSRRYAGLQILDALARHTPNMFYECILNSGLHANFFELLLPSLLHSKLLIRESCAKVLHECLVLTSSREGQTRDRWYVEIKTQIERGFESSRVEWNHGSILAIGELVSSRATLKWFKYLIDVCQLLTLVWDSKNGLIQAALLGSLPRIVAAFGRFQGDAILGHSSMSNTEVAQQAQEASKVRESFLDRSIVYVQRAVARGQSRSAALAALGGIIPELPNRRRHVLFDWFAGTSAKLLNERKIKSTLEIEATLQCTRQIIPAIDPGYVRRPCNFSSLLDALFEMPFTESLADTLQLVLVYFNHLTVQINTFVLDKLHKRLERGLIPGDDKVVEDIRMGLRILSTFEFGNARSAPSIAARLILVRDLAAPYINASDLGIDSRQNAIYACGKHLVPPLSIDTLRAEFDCEYKKGSIDNAAVDSILEQSQSQASDRKVRYRGNEPQLIVQLMQQLLRVSVSERSIELRLSSICALDQPLLDYYLVADVNRPFLLATLHDEVLEVKLTGLKILARMILLKGDAFMPQLQALLIQLISALQKSDDGDAELENLILLAHFVEHIPVLSQSYAGSIFQILLNRLKLSTVEDTTHPVCEAVGHMASIARCQIESEIDQIIPALFRIARDSTGTKIRCAAVHALGEVAKSTNCVTQVYLQYPELAGFLIATLKGDINNSLRCEVVRVLGILGPQPAATFSSTTSSQADELVLDRLEMHAQKGSDTYFLAAALNALIRIADNARQAAHHIAVVQALVVVFEYHSEDVFKFFFNRLIRAIVSMASLAHSAEQEDTFNYIFTELLKIIKLASGSITETEAHCILPMVMKVWYPSDSMFYAIEVIATEMRTFFKTYLSDFLQICRQHLNRYLEHMSTGDGVVGVNSVGGGDNLTTSDTAPESYVVMRTLGLIPTFGKHLDGQVHTVITPIAGIIDSDVVPIDVRASAIQTCIDIARTVLMDDVGVVLLHPVTRVLGDVPDLRPISMVLLEALVLHMRDNYERFGFLAIVAEKIAKYKIQADGYERLIRSWLSGIPLPSPLGTGQPRTYQRSESSKSLIRPVTLPIDMHMLREAWAITSEPSAEDWSEWLRRFSTALLKTSPYPALRACSMLAEFQPSLARELFNASFVACWDGLTASAQDELVHFIQLALHDEASNNKDVRVVILNLAEFMEFMDRGRLPIAEHVLGYSAYVSGAVAKSLRYKERELDRLVVGDAAASIHVARRQSFVDASPPSDSSSQPSRILSTVMDIIELNNALKLPAAAYGCVKAAKEIPGVGDQLASIVGSASGKLRHWDELLLQYRRQDDPSGSDVSDIGLNMVAYMRCLDKLYKWNELRDLVQGMWSTLDAEYASMVAPIACTAALHTRDWGSLAAYSEHLLEKDQRYMFKAISAIHNRQLSAALHFISSARVILPIVTEGSRIAPTQLVHAQLLCSLEEAISYIRAPNDSEVRQTYHNLWKQRVTANDGNIEVMHRLLSLNALALPLHNLDEAVVRFMNVCLDEGQSQLAAEGLPSFLKCDPVTGPKVPLADPLITLEWVKLLWRDGKSDAAIQNLSHLASDLAHCVSSSSSVANHRALLRTAAQAHSLLGQWKYDSAQHGLSTILTEEILMLHEKAISFDSSWDRVWLWWARINCKLLGFESDVTTASEYEEQYTVSAIKGFFKCISISTQQILQHTLCLIRLWFRHCKEPAVHAAINEGFASVSIDVWLPVLPQFLSRLDTSDDAVRESLYKIISDVAWEHPQAVVMPLLVIAQSERQHASIAGSILDNMRYWRMPDLFSEASLVSSELVRVAHLWHEQWHAAISTASTMFFDEVNFDGMQKLLQPLHAALKKPETLNEIAFSHSFGTDLDMAEALVAEYTDSRDMRCLSKAWSYYHDVFRRTSQMLPRLTLLDLNDVSPRLLASQQFHLAVPGTYSLNSPLVSIVDFDATLQVIASKQRPRKLALRGSDGKRYVYLLKSQEDLRVDERVMAFFELVNSFLVPGSNRQQILRYSVTPLAEKSGLIGWVDNCAMMHSLMVDARKRSGVVLHAEHMYIRQMAPQTYDADRKTTDKGYDILPVMQKIEIFESAVAKTDGKDLARMFWTSSPDSETWLARRTTYTISLAVMSMVGHVLGLGDRHPSNIMIEKNSGSVLHIDFGDCFEVAQQRSMYRERVPFRLTRQLVNAFEVGGIDGIYKSTCVDVMHALRQNKGSLLTVLELFVYDPLYEWTQDAESATVCVPGSQRSSPTRSSILEDVKRSATPSRNFNSRAISIMSRVQAKLSGLDFVAPNSASEPLDVTLQVEKLIAEATSVKNLSQSFMGWCPYW